METKTSERCEKCVVSLGKVPTNVFSNSMTVNECICQELFSRDGKPGILKTQKPMPEDEEKNKGTSLDTPLLPLRSCLKRKLPSTPYSPVHSLSTTLDLDSLSVTPVPPISSNKSITWKQDLVQVSYFENTEIDREWRKMVVTLGMIRQHQRNKEKKLAKLRGEKVNVAKNTKTMKMHERDVERRKLIAVRKLNANDKMEPKTTWRCLDDSLLIDIPEKPCKEKIEFYHPGELNQIEIPSLSELLNTPSEKMSGHTEIIYNYVGTPWPEPKGYQHPDVEIPIGTDNNMPTPNIIPQPQLPEHDDNRMNEQMYMGVQTPQQPIFMPSLIRPQTLPHYQEPRGDQQPNVKIPIGTDNNMPTPNIIPQPQLPEHDDNRMNEQMYMGVQTPQQPIFMPSLIRPQTLPHYQEPRGYQQPNVKIPIGMNNNMSTPNTIPQPRLPLYGGNRMNEQTYMGVQTPQRPIFIPSLLRPQTLPHRQVPTQGVQWMGPPGPQMLYEHWGQQRPLNNCPPPHFIRGRGRGYYRWQNSRGNTDNVYRGNNQRGNRGCPYIRRGGFPGNGRPSGC